MKKTKKYILISKGLDSTSWLLTHIFSLVLKLWNVFYCRRKNMIVISNQGAPLASYQPRDIVLYYKLPPPQCYLSLRWYCEFNSYSKENIKSWWRELASSDKRLVEYTKPRCLEKYINI